MVTVTLKITVSPTVTTWLCGCWTMVGGTNTRVALAEGTRLLDGSVRKYSNADYPGLETVLRQYVSEEDNVDCKGACVAVAGPVTTRDGRQASKAV